MRTWASVCSIKRRFPSRFLFPRFLSYLTFDSVPDTPPPNEFQKGKKKNIRTKTYYGTGRYACVVGFVVTEALARMTL